MNYSKIIASTKKDKSGPTACLMGDGKTNTRNAEKGDKEGAHMGKGGGMVGGYPHACGQTLCSNVRGF